MNNLRTVFCGLLIAAFAVFPATATGQQLGSDGSIYVNSQNGKRVLAEAGHCAEVSGSVNGRLLACAVADPQFATPQRLEVYSADGPIAVVDPGAPIDEWHFWNGDLQIAVFFGSGNGTRGTHALYDASTGKLFQTVQEPPDEKLLPQWAKGPADLEEESLSMSPAAQQERRIWISHVLRQSSQIQPGMRRKDLLKIFTTEGGISTRFQRTYVHRECEYVKVDVLFRGIENPHNAIGERPDDIIVSISRPYLDWSHTD